MSKHNDAWVVVHTNDGTNRDLVLNFGIGNVEKVSEFVVRKEIRLPLVGESYLTLCLTRLDCIGYDVQGAYK